MSDDERHRASIALVEEAIAALPGILVDSLAVSLPVAHESMPLVTTGIGASEGPARLLASRVAAVGRPARFASISELTSGSHVGERLVAFSQGLSPNARLTLADDLGFAERWLVTSVGYDHADEAKRAIVDRLIARGIVPVVVPPATEARTLARLRGPTVATLTALRLAGALGSRTCTATELVHAPTLYERASSVGVDLGDGSRRAFAFATAGIAVDDAFGARWKLLETLLVPDPPTWDALAFGHGPLQAMRGKDLTILALSTPRGRAFVDGLAASIDPDHHRLVRLEASTDGPLSAIEHLATLDASLLATLRAHPRNLFDWPSRGNECPLYALGEDLP